MVCEPDVNLSLCNGNFMTNQHRTWPETNKNFILRFNNPRSLLQDVVILRRLTSVAVQRVIRLCAKSLSWQVTFIAVTIVEVWCNGILG